VGHSAQSISPLQSVVTAGQLQSQFLFHDVRTGLLITSYLIWSNHSDLNGQVILLLSFKVSDSKCYSWLQSLFKNLLCICPQYSKKKNS